MTEYERRRAYFANYRATKRKERAARCIAYRLANPQIAKAYEAKRPHRKRAAYFSAYFKQPERRIIKRLCGRLRAFITGRTLRSNLFGCPAEFLRAHIERQFLPGMTWDNYGIKGWHIDHKLPCSVFDLTKREQQLICFNWQNLQPMWAKANLSKGDTIVDGQFPLPLAL